MTEVIVYSTQECPWCKKVKAFLKEHDIAFKDLDVGSDTEAAQEMIKKSGQQGVPVIDAKGKIIVGFDENALREALDIKRD